MKRWSASAVLAGLIIGVDQISKALVRYYELPVTHNASGAFSLPWPHFGLLLAMTVVLGLVWILRDQLSFVVILAGGASNLIDRLVHGYVIDIFTIYRLDFNIADIAICIGSLMLLYYAVIHRSSYPQK